MYFIINYGLTGSLKGTNYYEVITAINEKEAGEYAHEEAEQLFEMYSNHFRDEINEIEESGEDYDEAYSELVESWTSTSVYDYNDENVKKFINRHYSNPYKKEMTKAGILSQYEK